jgi:hypothetical protein
MQSTRNSIWSPNFWKVQSSQTLKIVNNFLPIVDFATAWKYIYIGTKVEAYLSLKMVGSLSVSLLVSAEKSKVSNPKQTKHSGHTDTEVSMSTKTTVSI